MVHNVHLDRRRFLGLGAGSLMVAALAPTGALAQVQSRGGNGRLIPPPRVGTILYTQRDAISRWGVQSLDALTIISRSYGAELRYGDFAARLFDDGGAQLYSSDFSSGDFIF